MKTKIKVVAETAQDIDSLRCSWAERPDFALMGGKLHYCRYRCLSSEQGGGNCRCINHPAEEWIRVE